MYKFFKQLPWSKYTKLKKGITYTGTHHRFGESFILLEEVKWESIKSVKYEVQHERGFIDYCGDNTGFVNEWGFKLITTKKEFIQVYFSYKSLEIRKYIVNKVAQLLKVELES